MYMYRYTDIDIDCRPAKLVHPALVCEYDSLDDAHPNLTCKGPCGYMSHGVYSVSTTNMTFTELLQEAMATLTEP